MKLLANQEINLSEREVRGLNLLITTAKAFIKSRLHGVTPGDEAEYRMRRALEDLGEKI